MATKARYSGASGQFRHSVLPLLPVSNGDAFQMAIQNGMQVLSFQHERELYRILETADIIELQWWNNPQLDYLLRGRLPAGRFLAWCHVGGHTAPQVITDQLLESADQIVACSPYTYESPLIQALPVQQRRETTQMIYACADIERIKGVAPGAHNEFNIGYIGTVHFIKLHRNYIRMSAAIQIPNAKFVICGRGGAEPILQEEARDLGVTDRFKFLGQVDDLRPVLSVLDVYGYPLCEDTYAAAELNIQEVMYAGIPSVVFPYGGLKHLITDNFTGLFVRSEQEYIEAIEYLYHNPAERIRIGGNAAEYARQIFDPNKSALKFNALYEQMMKKPKCAWGLKQVALNAVAGEELPAIIGNQTFRESLGPEREPFDISAISEDYLALVDADRRIMQVKEVMKNTILDYCKFYPSDPYLRLWAGLAHLGNDSLQNAMSEFIECLKCGFNHWRILWYLEQAARLSGQTAIAEAARSDLEKIQPGLPPLTSIVRHNPQM